MKKINTTIQLFSWGSNEWSPPITVDTFIERCRRDGLEGVSAVKIIEVVSKADALDIIKSMQ